MKRLGLFPALLSATLFLIADLPAQEPAPAPPPKKLSERDAELLKRYDKNGDGKLDQDELALAHESMRGERMTGENVVTPGVRDKLLERFDTNHDGKLDDDERAAMRKALGQAQDFFRARMMERFDVNHDGKLDETERAAARRALDDFFAGLDEKP